MEAVKQRNINIDVIKCIASFFVVSVHFFLNNNFYGTIIDSPRMYIMGIMRTFFMMCVPLFLLITGYLMNKKEFSEKYYKGIVNILILYFIISIFTLIAKIVLSNFGIFPIQNFLYYISEFIDFKLVGYAWYIDMYIGLFLLIPFINKMFTNHKQDFILILILLFLTLLPQISQAPTFIISFWTSLWPITYYVIGAYISRYGVNISTKTLMYLFVVFFCFFSTNNLISVRGSLWNIEVAWGGLQNVIHSVLFFIILLRINFKNLPLKTKNLISGIAKLSLGIYLSSYLFDKIIYYYFNSYITETAAKLECFFIIVPLVFICSLLMAKLVDLIVKKFNLRFM